MHTRENLIENMELLVWNYDVDLNNKTAGSEDDSVIVGKLQLLQTLLQALKAEK